MQVSETTLHPSASSLSHSSKSGTIPSFTLQTATIVDPSIINSTSTTTKIPTINTISSKGTSKRKKETVVKSFAKDQVVSDSTVDNYPTYSKNKFLSYPNLVDIDKAIYQYKHAAEGPHQEHSSNNYPQTSLEWYQTLMEQNFSLSSSATVVSTLRSSKYVKGSTTEKNNNDEDANGSSLSIHEGMFCPPLRNNVYYAPSDYTTDHPDDASENASINSEENETMVIDNNKPISQTVLPLPKHELQLNHIRGFGYHGYLGRTFPTATFVNQSSSSSSSAISIIQNFAVRRSYSNVKIPLCYVTGKSIVLIDLCTYLSLDISMNNYLSLTDTVVLTNPDNVPPVVNTNTNISIRNNNGTATIDNPLRSNGSSSGSQSGKNSVVLSPFVTTSNQSTVGSVTGGLSRKESARSLLHSSIGITSSGASTVIHGSSSVPTESIGRKQRIYTKHSNPVTHMICHPFLPIVATAENTTTNDSIRSIIRVWHTNTLEDFTNPLECRFTVHSLGFSSNGYYLLALLCNPINNEFLLYVWDLQEFSLPSDTTDTPLTTLNRSSDNNPSLILPCSRFAPSSTSVSSFMVPSISMISCSPCPDSSLAVGWPDILFLYNGALVMLSFSRTGPDAPLQANILEGDYPSETIENIDDSVPTSQGSSFVQAIHFICQGIELVAVAGQEGWVRILAGAETAAELAFTPTQPIIALALLPTVCVFRHKSKETNELSNGTFFAVSFADGSVSLVYCNFDPDSSTVNVQIVDTFMIDASTLSVFDSSDTPSSVVAQYITGSVVPRNDGIYTGIIAIETSSKQFLRTTRYFQMKNKQISIITNTDSLKSTGSVLTVHSPLYPSVMHTLESGRWAATIVASIAHPYLPIFALGHSNGTVTVWDAVYNIWIGTIDAPINSSSNHCSVSSLDFSAEGCVLGVGYTPTVVVPGIKNDNVTPNEEGRSRSQVIIYRITLPASYLRKLASTSFARNSAVAKYKTAHKILRNSLQKNVNGKKNIDPQSLQHSLFATAVRWYLSPNTTNNKASISVTTVTSSATRINCIKFAPLGTHPGGNNPLPTRGNVISSTHGNAGPSVAGTLPVTESNFEKNVSFTLTVALGLSDGTTEIYVVNAALPALPSPSSTPSVWSTAASASLHPSSVASSKMEETRVQRRKIFRWMYHQPNIVAAALGDTEQVLSYTNIGVNGMDWDTTGRYIQVSMSNYESVVWEACATGSASYIRKVEMVRDVVWATQNNLLGWNVSGIWYASLPQLLSNTSNLGTIPMEPLFNEINCVTKNNSGNDILVTGGSDGHLRLYRYPAVAPVWTKNNKQCSYHEYRSAHVRSVSYVSFGGTGSDEYLLSTAAEDNGAGVAVWELKWPKEFTDILVTETSGIAEAPSAIAHAKATAYVRPVTNAVMMDPIRDMLRRYFHAVNNLSISGNNNSSNNMVSLSSSSTPGNHSTPNSGRVSPFAHEILNKMTDTKQLVMFDNPSASMFRNKMVSQNNNHHRSSPNVPLAVSSTSSPNNNQISKNNNSPLHSSSSSSESNVLQNVPFSISIVPQKALTKHGSNDSMEDHNDDHRSGNDYETAGGMEKLTEDVGLFDDTDNILENNNVDDGSDQDNDNDDELNGDNSYQESVKRLEERVVINSAVQTHENTTVRSNEARIQSLQGFSKPHLKLRGRAK